MKYTQHSLLFKDTEDTNLRRREGMAVQEEKIVQARGKGVWKQGAQKMEIISVWSI